MFLKFLKIMKFFVLLYFITVNEKARASKLESKSASESKGEVGGHLTLEETEEIDYHATFNDAIEQVTLTAFLIQPSKLDPVFSAVGEKLHNNLLFAHVNLPEEAVKAKESLVLYRPTQLSNKFEPDYAVYDGDFVEEKIENFIANEFHGLAGIRETETMKDFNFKAPLVIAYFDRIDFKRNAKGSGYWRNRVLKVAQNFKKDFNFAISPKEQFYLDIEKEFGSDVAKNLKPIVTAIDLEGKTFLMTTEFSMENFAKFLDKLRNRVIKPFLKSQPISTESEGPVEVAVALNFEDVVFKNGNDTLIQFYSPRSSACRKFNRIYDQLAIKLMREEVKIVKMDAIANKVPDLFGIVREYPSLYWIPRNKNKVEPVKCEGGQGLNDLIKYLADHSTDGFKGFDHNANRRKEEL